jgi:hypothetical protein
MSTPVTLLTSTTTLTVLTTSPFVAVIKYAVVPVGLTSLLPVFATFPMPGLIVTDEALETFQLSIAEPPILIAAGLAVKELITGTPERAGVSVGDESPAEATITRTVAVLLPPGPVAVKVYTVVEDGVTLRSPLRLHSYIVIYTDSSSIGDRPTH